MDWVVLDSLLCVADCLYSFGIPFFVGSIHGPSSFPHEESHRSRCSIHILPINSKYETFLTNLYRFNSQQ